MKKISLIATFSLVALQCLAVETRATSIRQLYRAEPVGAAKAEQTNQFYFCDNCPPRFPLSPAPVAPPVAQGQPGIQVEIVTANSVEIPQQVAGDEKTEVKDEDCLVGTVFFRIDSPRLSPDAKKDIRGFAERILKLGLEDEVTVKGYTCQLGEKKHNDSLAQKRAEAVAEELQKNGVAHPAISSEGECCFLDEVKIELNRRAEVWTEGVCQ